jgi:hypothetical protein
VKDDGAGIGRQYFKDLIVAQSSILNLLALGERRRLERPASQPTRSRAYGSTSNTVVPFNEVLGRLRRQMGNRSVPEVVVLAKQAIALGERKSKSASSGRADSWWVAAEIRDQPAHRTLDSRQSADRHRDPPRHHGGLVRSCGGPGDRERKADWARQ